MFTYKGTKIKGAWTSDDGVKYPRGWVEGATPQQLIDIGVTEVADILPPDYDSAIEYITEQQDGSYIITPLPQETVDNKARQAELSILDNIDKLSMRDIREMVAALPNAPQTLIDREAEAVAARIRLNAIWYVAFIVPLFAVGIDMRERIVSKTWGSDYVRDDFNNTGFQVLVAKSKQGKKSRYSLYWVTRYRKSSYAVVVQLGWKIKLSHNGMDEENENKYWKGFTAEINPAKNIS